MWRSKSFLILLVLAAFIVRLIQLNQPFIDPWSWRQSDVAAIARNYFENGFHFYWPQIDWAGDAPGFVGTECPILPFMAALTYKITGVQDWVGRIQGVLLFVGALPFFFLLVRRIYGETVARWATFFFAFAPLSVIASRAFMPDVPSLSLSIVGLYLFSRWIDNRGWPLFIGSALLLSLALLTKLPRAVIAVPILYLLVKAATDRQRPWWTILARWELWFFAVIALLPSLIWYRHAYRISETFYPYHFFGDGGFRIMSPGWYWKIGRETVLSSLTPILAALAIFGAFIIPPVKYRWIFHWWFAVMILFVFLVGWGNRHQWYQLPFVPIAAVFAGCACQWIETRLRSNRVAWLVASLLLATTFIASAYQSSRPFYRPAAATLRNLGLELGEATTSSALIVAADDGDPTAFYYAHRKGWHFLGDGVYKGPPLNSAQAIANLEELQTRGATHLAFTKATQWWLKQYPEFAEYLVTNATLVDQTTDFTIYKLERP